MLDRDFQIVFVEKTLGPTRRNVIKAIGKKVNFEKIIVFSNFSKPSGLSTI